MQFQDELAGGVVLVRPALQSPNYSAGSAGWAVKVDGSAEFNNVTIRGATVAGGNALYYNGTPAAGNLIVSISGAAGSDTFGNAYVKGIGAYGAAGQIVAKDSAGDTAILAGTIPTSGTLAAMPGLAMQPKLHTGDPATIGALDDGTHTNFSLLLTSPSNTTGGIPGTNYSQINMVGPDSAPCSINLDAQQINFNSAATIDAASGMFTSYGFDIFNTYAPTVANGGSATFSTRTGWWMRVGKMVYVCAYLVVNAAGSGTGIVTVTTPTAVDRTTRQALTVHSESNGAGGNATSAIRGGECVFFVGGSGATADRIRVDNGTGVEANIQGVDLLAGGILTIQGWYREA